MNIFQRTFWVNPRIRLSVLFYGIFIAVAWLWGILAYRPNILFNSKIVNWSLVGWGAIAGLLIGFLVVGLSRLAENYFSWAKNLAHWFAEVLGPINPAEALILALLSSTGEEFFFRGAMQPTLGLWLTSIIFGLVHFPRRWQYWPWTFMALILGFCFGGLSLWTGNLAGPIIAHFIINWLNLKRIGQRALELGKERKSSYYRRGH